MYRRPKSVPNDHFYNAGLNDDRTGSRDGILGDRLQSDLIHKSIWGIDSIRSNTDIRLEAGADDDDDDDLKQ